MTCKHQKSLLPVGPGQVCAWGRRGRPGPRCRGSSPLLLPDLCAPWPRGASEDRHPIARWQPLYEACTQNIVFT